MPDRFHRTLARQLRRTALGSDPPADRGAWLSFLELVSSAYTDADNDRYTLERSIEVSSGEMRALHDRLSVQAHHDALTGLWNRAALIQKLEEILAGPARGASYAAILFVDLDRFKMVNDSLGHIAGDELLVRAAERLKAVTQSADVVSRIGGDEFVVVSTRVKSYSGATATANRIVEAFSAPFIVSGRSVNITASVGVARADEVATSAADLLRRADLAMYQVKAAGRSGVATFQHGMQTAAERRMATETELHRAIRHDELVVHYQPVRRLSDEGLLGFEALVRWNHPVNGLLYPGDFIPVAEVSNVIDDLGTWVLARACRDAAGWPDRSVEVAVNISARTLLHEGIVGAVTSALERSGLDPHRLTIEVTESALTQDGRCIAATLDRLREIGVQLALDDFGKGYSSLARLRDLSVDVLKIDRSFMSKVETDDADAAVVGAITALGHALGLHVIAEGVERPEQLARLQILGCDSVQGFHVGRPAPADELAPYFETSAASATSVGAQARSRPVRLAS